VVVEPQTGPFSDLRVTYGDAPRLTLRNVAIGERNEVRPFYRVAPGPTVPAWAAQLASFDPAVIMRHGGPSANLRENLTCEDVQCVTFESLLADVDRVDLLQIDAEGYDATLLRLFDFERWKPSIVQFEHKHLSVAEHDAAIRHIVAYGYRIAIAQLDTVAYIDRRDGTTRK
jgi:FkbM family methyltransferase